MRVLAISGGDFAVGFRIDVSAVIGVIVSAIVIALLARDCFGKSRAAFAAALLLFGVHVSLATTSSPVRLLAMWQLQSFLIWGLALFFSDEHVQGWLGRIVLSGWLVDAVLIAGSIALMTRAGADDFLVTSQIVAWGLALSLAGRIAVLPVGAHLQWNDRPRQPAISWMLLAILPPATIFGVRLLSPLEQSSELRFPISQFLVFAALAAAVGSLRQESSLRALAWRISAAVAGVAALSLLVPAWVGCFLWAVAAIGMAIVVPRLEDGTARRANRPSNASLLDRLEIAAANEWGLPRAWKFLVAVPARGASQVLRFADGFVFEQLPLNALRRLRGVTDPVSRAVPELFGRLLVPILTVLAFMVLLALAFR